MPKPIACDSPYALGDRGVATYPNGPDVIVQWPRCPRNWHVARRWGNTLMPLHVLCDWALERGLHKRDDLGAPGQRLLLEASRIRETPRKLLELKRFDERKKKGGA